MTKGTPEYIQNVTATAATDATDLEIALDNYAEWMKGRATGARRKTATATAHASAVRTFLPGLSKDHMLSLERMGEKGGLISSLLDSGKLTAVSLQVYTHSLASFLDYLIGAKRHLRKAGVTVTRAKKIADSVKNIYRSLKADVNRQEVERNARGDKDLRVDTWMVSEYLKGGRPIRASSLIEKRENGESVDPTQTLENLIKFKVARARARRTIKRSKRTSWRQYVSRLNSRSSVKKTWDMVRKISGKNSSLSVGHLDTDNGVVSSKPDIANVLADTFAKKSSSSNYTPAFQKHQEQTEKVNLNFKSKNTEHYNKEFTLKELKTALKKCHDTAVGCDDIHYQFLKHLPHDPPAVEGD